MKLKLLAAVVLLSMAGCTPTYTRNTFKMWTYQCDGKLTYIIINSENKSTFTAECKYE